MKKIITVLTALVLFLSAPTAFAAEATPFVDIKGHWAQGSIETLYESGLISGVDANHFAPNREISRAEFAALLVRAFELKNDPSVVKTFKDVKPGKWYSATVEVVAENGLMSGYSDNTFHPYSPISREEIAVIFTRILNEYEVALDLTTKDEKEIIDLFDDRSKITWSKSGVAQMVASGIMGGRKETLFGPRDRASRAEAATILVRFAVYMVQMSEEQ
jgi:hypothetical protein